MQREITSGLGAKLKVNGEWYIQVWAPVHGHHGHNPSIVTMCVANALSHKLEVGEQHSLASHVHFNQHKTLEQLTTMVNLSRYINYTGWPA